MIARNLAIAALFLVRAAAAHAQSALEVAPTSLELKPGEAGLLYVANRGNAPLTAQLEPFDWHQRDGADALSQSETLDVSPPLTTLAPGERQTIRVMADANGAAESDYRLMISQLPPAGAAQAGKVRMLLQFSVPVFVSAEKPPPPALSWEARESGGPLVLLAHNNGAHSVHLTGFSVSTRDGLRLSVVRKHLGYVLPGQTQGWIIAGHVAALHVSARDARSGAAVEADVAVHS